MTDVIVLAIVAAIVIAVSRYIYRAKKRGVKCIGCPSSGGDGHCSGGCGGCGSCHNWPNRIGDL